MLHSLTHTGIGAAVWNLLGDLFDLLDAQLTLMESGGTVTADGTEQTLYIENAPVGCFEPRTFVVDLDNMDAGDTTIVRVYYRIIAGGGLQQEVYTSFAGADGGLANGSKLFSFSLHPNRFGMSISLRQTAGVNRTYNWSVMVEG